MIFPVINIFSSLFLETQFLREGPLISCLWGRVVWAERLGVEFNVRNSLIFSPGIPNSWRSSLISPGNRPLTRPKCPGAELVRVRLAQVCLISCCSPPFLSSSLHCLKLLKPILFTFTLWVEKIVEKKWRHVVSHAAVFNKWIDIYSLSIVLSLPCLHSRNNLKYVCCVFLGTQFFPQGDRQGHTGVPLGGYPPYLTAEWLLSVWVSMSPVVHLSS